MTCDYTICSVIINFRKKYMFSPKVMKGMHTLTTIIVWNQPNENIEVWIQESCYVSVLHWVFTFLWIILFSWEQMHFLSIDYKLVYTLCTLILSEYYHGYSFYLNSHNLAIRFMLTLWFTTYWNQMLQYREYCCHCIYNAIGGMLKIMLITISTLSL